MIITDKRGQTYNVMQSHMGGGLVVYYATHDNVPIARAVLNVARCCIQDVVIYDVDDRRQGIATALYDAIEAERRIKLVPNALKLEAGKAFWRSRNVGKFRRSLGRMAPTYAKPRHE